MELIVGGMYDQIGFLEYSLLRHIGLQPEHNIVDVGCGSGRLAAKLYPYLRGNYVGTDILPEVVDFARAKYPWRNFQFLAVPDCRIPVDDASAEYVTFFSVFTHLVDEDCYRYLREARRVAQSRARIVVTFLDFDEPWHYPIFEDSLASTDPDRVLNRFLSKSALQKWCEVLGLQLEHVYTGSRPWIPIDHDIIYDDGRRVAGLAEFGQSVAILRR
ncbi:MAG TPA: class I SAM-dependent methyltransferase [Opitutaceae bacterium]|nr:class I SAM-dependent methyltransferase [Opitutaceae bacterium]